MNKHWDFSILQALASLGGNSAVCTLSDPGTRLRDLHGFKNLEPKWMRLLFGS